MTNQSIKLHVKTNNYSVKQKKKTKQNKRTRSSSMHGIDVFFLYEYIQYKYTNTGGELKKKY